MKLLTSVVGGMTLTLATHLTSLSSSSVRERSSFSSEEGGGQPVSSEGRPVGDRLSNDRTWQGESPNLASLSVASSDGVFDIAGVSQSVVSGWNWTPAAVREGITLGAAASWQRDRRRGALPNTHSKGEMPSSLEIELCPHCIMGSHYGRQIRIWLATVRWLLSHTTLPFG